MQDWSSWECVSEASMSTRPYLGEGLCGDSGKFGHVSGNFLTKVVGWSAEKKEREGNLKVIEREGTPTGKRCGMGMVL